MNDVIFQQKRSQQELAALEVAEEARSALEALPSFAAGLFMGRCQWDLIHPFPMQDEADKREGDALIEKIGAYLKTHLDPEDVDLKQAYPKEVLKGLADMGCFGLKIPKEYGGLGISQINYSRIMEMMGSYCSATVVWLSAHQSIGVPQPLILVGTDAQKKKYLPLFAKGAVSAFALTEPDVGSDPATMKTTAKLAEDGSAYILNGEKLWCTNGPDADILIVMAKTAPKIVSGKEKQQITAFIVETSSPGFEVAHRCKFMGMRGISNGLLRFNNVRVPKENVLWGEGNGLKLALMTLNAGRLTIPSAGLGACKQSLKIMREWGNKRVQWGYPVGRHEFGAEKIAQTAATIFALESITHLTCMIAQDHKQDIRIEAAMAKYFGSENGWKVMDETLQLRGGRGFETEGSLRERGEEAIPVERMMRDMRINRIIEGTSEIMKLFLSREVLDPHLKIAGAALNKKLSFKVRVKGLFKAMAAYAKWYPQQWFYWPRKKVFSQIHPKLRWQMMAIECLSHKLARCMFHQMIKFGPKLEKRQLILGRLVEIGIELYAMSAACVRASRLSGSEKLHDEKSHETVRLADAFCRYSKQRIRHKFREIRCNTDRHYSKLADEILDGKHLFLEKGILR